MNELSDNINKEFIKSLYDQIESWRDHKSPEIPFKDIEDFMVKKLGAAPPKNKSGSARSFYHVALKPYGANGNVTIHVSHKKRPNVTKLDFRKYLYPAMKIIIEWIKEKYHV